MADREPRNNFERFVNLFTYAFEAPATWFRETVVEPNRPKYNYYHRQYRRVPSIDECEVGDPLCIFEAEQQFQRDRRIDSEILSILRRRKEDCYFAEYPNTDRCSTLVDQYNLAVENWFIKYGDLGKFQGSVACYFKQKHRLIWERRHPDANLATPE